MADSSQQHVTFSLADNSQEDDADGFRNYYSPLASIGDGQPTDDDRVPFTSAYPKPSLSANPADQMAGLSHTNEIIDQSRSHDSEQVVEVSKNQRYVRLNTLLGKGAYKVVYKAIDREEGYEVAWNTMQVRMMVTVVVVVVYTLTWLLSNWFSLLLRIWNMRLKS